MNSGYTDHTLTEAIEGLRTKMQMEHDPAWQAGVHALIQEMMLTAAKAAIQRSETARSDFYGALVPLLPEPALAPPTALQSEPVQQFNGHHRDHYPDDDLDVPNVARRA